MAVNVSMPRKQRNHPTGSRYGSRLGDLRQARVQLQQARLRVIDRQQIVVDHRALGRVRPRQTVDPRAMRLRPIPPA